MMKNESLIIENQYFGTINYYKMLFQYSNIKFNEYDRFQKMSYSNRCLIPAANGVIALSVPLEKGRDQKAPMKDIKISYRDNWVQQHIRTLEATYNRAPFFEFYRDSVVGLLESRPAFLLDMNLQTLHWIFQKLGKTSPMTTDLMTNDPVTNDPMSIDHRYKILPKNRPLSIEKPAYTQVFQDKIGYQPDMCILDLLFCTGKQAIHLLTDSKNSF